MINDKFFTTSSKLMAINYKLGDLIFFTLQVPLGTSEAVDDSVNEVVLYSILIKKTCRNFQTANRGAAILVLV
jgi:hypothetical protein